MQLVDPKVELLNAEELKDFYTKAGLFASECYDTQKGFKSVGKDVIESGHATAFRNQVMFRFRITGVSRVWSHEDVRHKVGVDDAPDTPTIKIGVDEMDSNQRSQRYVTEDGFKVIIPDEILDKIVTVNFDGLRNVGTDVSSIIDLLQQFYNGLVAQGVSPQIARYVLPNACETRLKKVFSFQALQHYCNKRLCSRAQPEMREVARLMKREIQDKVSEELAQYFVPQCSPMALGYCPESKRNWEKCKCRPHKSEVMEYLEDHFIHAEPVL